MRMLSTQEFEKDPKACLAEAEAGQRVILLRGGQVVAELVPASESAHNQLWKTEEERLAAGKRLSEIMDRGYDLGGFKITNRDELYDRD